MEVNFGEGDRKGLDHGLRLRSSSPFRAQAAMASSVRLWRKTGSGEVVNRDRDRIHRFPAPPSRARLPKRSPPRVPRASSSPGSSRLARVEWARLPDLGVRPAARISPAQGLIPDEPRCKPGSTAGTAESLAPLHLFPVAKLCGRPAAHPKSLCCFL
jgi:hypothetical protein